MPGVESMISQHSWTRLDREAFAHVVRTHDRWIRIVSHLHSGVWFGVSGFEFRVWGFACVVCTHGRWIRTVSYLGEKSAVLTTE